MNIELAVLRVSPREFTPALLLVVAAPAHMIEGEVSNGAPTIRDEYGRLEARHSSLQVKFLPQIYEKCGRIPSGPASIPKWSLFQMHGIVMGGLSSQHPGIGPSFFHIH